MEKRKIEVKNYIIYAILVVLTMMVVFYLGKWYRTTELYRREENVMISVLSQVKLNELGSYLIENPNAVVYISNESEDIKEYEKKLKDLVIRYELRDEMIFLELENTKELETLNEKYCGTALSFTTPNLLVFEEAKIVSVMKTGDQQLEEQATIEFLKQNGIINEP